MDNFIRDTKNSQFLKYLLVGGLNFFFGLIVFYVFLKILLLKYSIALTITWVLGLLLTYVINFSWVFKPEDRLSFKRHFVKYFLAQLLCFGLNLFSLRFISNHTAFDPYYVQLGLIPFILVFNFLTTKLWALKAERDNRLTISVWQNVMGKYLNTFMFICIIGLFLGQLSYFIWALSRGFDISDESYYVLLAIHPSAVKLFNSAQHWFTSIIWQVTGSLYLFRLSGLAILLCTSMLFTKGAIHACKIISVIGSLQKKEKIIVYACSLSGALLYGTTTNFSPCYNLLDAATAYSSIGLVLLTLGRGPDYKTKLLCFFSGCILGIAVLNKFSAGLAIMGLIFIFLIFLSNNIRSKISGVCFVFIGILITLLSFILYHTITSNVIHDFQFGMAVFKSVQTEPTLTRLIRYFWEFSSQIFWSGIFFVLLFALSIKYLKAFDAHLHRKLTLFGIVLVSCYYLPQAFTILGIQGIRWVFLTALLACVFAISLFISLNKWTKNSKTTILTMGLGVLPYFTAIGTGNGINTQIVGSLAFWGCLIAILWISNKSQNENKNLSIVTCVLFVFIITYQIVVCSFAPYHLNGSIWEQDIPTEIGSIGMIKTDQKTHDFIDELTLIKRNYIKSSTEPYLCFYREPGIALIIDVVPIFSPYLILPKQSELMLAQVPPAVLKSAIVGIVLNDKGERPSLPAQFSDFPANYKKCGELFCPYTYSRFQIWLPNQ